MKKLLTIIPLVILLCFIFGCQDKAAIAELEEFRAQAAIEEQNKEVVKRLNEELNKGIDGNNEVFAELFGPATHIKLHPIALCQNT